MNRPRIANKLYLQTLSYTVKPDQDVIIKNYIDGYEKEILYEGKLYTNVTSKERDILDNLFYKQVYGVNVEDNKLIILIDNR